ncbi:hypothetical protein TU75_11175 [Pseudomonas poae]|nr:hypothetical protein TU75_11175 [Pseudomonas poae]KTC37624.1 hypothetical protein AO260_02850 [Pseudomonas sp. ABAC21]
MLNQFGVFYIPQAFARDDNNIPTNQSVLVEAKRFAHQTLEAIALNGELYALLADHQPETGMIKIVVTRKEQEIFPRNLAGGGVKDCLEVPGGKQTLFPTEVLTHHQYRIIKLPDAHDLWRDDATGQHGRSW